MGGDVGGVRETLFLRDGQGIEFGAQHDHRARAVLENPDHAGAAKSGGDVVSELAKLVGDFGRSLLLMIGKLGIAMQVEIDRFDLGIDGLDLGGSGSAWLSGAQRYGNR